VGAAAGAVGAPPAGGAVVVVGVLEFAAGGFVGGVSAIYSSYTNAVFGFNAVSSLIVACSGKEIPPAEFRS